MSRLRFPISLNHTCNGQRCCNPSKKSLHDQEAHRTLMCWFFALGRGSSVLWALVGQGRQLLQLQRPLILTLDEPLQRFCGFTLVHIQTSAPCKTACTSNLLMAG